MVPTKPPIDPILRLSENGLAQSALAKDAVLHDRPLLVLIGVDSEPLVSHFWNEVCSTGVSVKRSRLISLEDISTFLLRPEVLQYEGVHFLDLFHHGEDSKEVARAWLFRRDIIASEQLAVVLVVTHDQLNELVGEGYDFFSVATFTGYFTDRVHQLEQAWAVFWRELGEIPDQPPPDKLSGKECYRVGRRYTEKGLVQMAAPYIAHAAKLLQNQPRLKAYVDWETARIYQNTNRLAEAEHRFLEALSQFRELRDLDGELLTINSLARYYIFIGNKEEAYRFIELAIIYGEAQKYPLHQEKAMSLQQVSLNAMVGTLPPLQDLEWQAYQQFSLVLAETEPEKAQPLINQILALASDSGRPDEIASSIFRIGLSCMAHSDNDLGALYFTFANACFEHLGNMLSKNITQLNWADACLRQGRVREAISLIEPVRSAWEKEAKTPLFYRAALLETEALAVNGLWEQAEQLMDRALGLS